MNVIEKIKRSWWVILSFIMFINGFGFVYIGLKQNNKHWVMEGITYEIPWLIYFVYYIMFNVHAVGFQNPTGFILTFAGMLLLVSIVRSFWVAIKLADVYDNEEKYTVRPTVMNKQKVAKKNDGFSSWCSCCLCIFIIIVVFAIFGIL